ncbi:MAG TPA: TolC family protein [Anaeromyxobacteraceae bacterium]|nr:TolC family protein [Anaeromyxobacteraceae bacterium]
MRSPSSPGYRAASARLAEFLGAPGRAGARRRGARHSGAALVLALLTAGPVAARAQAEAPAAARALLPPELSPLPDAILKARVAGPEAVTFEEAVERAVRYGTSSLVSLQEIVRAQGLLGQARSAALPLVTLSGSYTLIDHQRAIVGGILIQGQQTLYGSATLSVPLVAPQAWVGWAQGAEGIDVAVASDASVRRTAAITAAHAYLTVVAAHRTVEVSDTAVATSRAHYDYSLARRRGGVGNELDVKRAEQEMAASDVQLQAAYTALARSREALGIICGSQLPLDSTSLPTAPSYPDLEQAEGGIEGREDVRAAKEQAKAARAVWKESWADWMPILTGSLQGFLQNPATTATPSEGWIAQLILTLPLFEGGLRPALSQQREALARESEAQLRGALLQAGSDVRVSFEALRYAFAGYEAARRGAVSAVAALDLANQAYRAGATSNLEVIDAEQRARDAALTAVIAEDAVRQARVDLLAAAGRFP